MSLFRRTEERALTEDDFPWLDSVASSWLSPERALSVIPVYAAVRLISETLASFPLHAYTRGGEGRRRVDLPTFLATPADGSTTVEWLQRGAVSALLQGNAYGYVTGMDRSGWPSGIVWLNPSRVTCAVETGSVRPTYWYDGRRLDNSQMVHIPAVVMPGKPDGVNPVRAFAASFDAAQEAQTGRRDWARNRQIPGSKLRNTNKTLTPDQADKISARAEEKIRNGKVFAYGSDWEFDVISLPSQDVAFLESIKADANLVASIYTVPPELIGGTTGGSLTYNTVEGQFNWILTMTTRTWVTKFEAAFARIMPRPQYVKFAVDAAIRTDVSTRYSTYRINREIGLRNLDELRELEDLPPLPNGEGQSYAPLALTQKAAQEAPK